MQDLVLLKFGGSLITDKNRPSTPRPDVIARLAREIADAWGTQGPFPLVVGHGSGSFGHTTARKHGTRNGVTGREAWLGFAEVWKDARALNQIVVEALLEVGLPVIAFPPSAALTARDGRLERWDTGPLESALAAGLVPLVNGDTVFDLVRGGTIFSTEDVFAALARRFTPGRILLAGIDEGVWADFPACTRLIDVITPSNFSRAAENIRGSASVDVTGGMLEKVRSMLELVEEIPDLQSYIFSGLVPGNVRSVLQGASRGTCIRTNDSIY